MKKINPLKTIGSYHLIKSLGKGGMGEVFLAYDTVCKREIALKQIREDLLSFPSIRNRFLREAHIASQLTHPSIVPIFSIYQDPEKIYYTMPCIEGETLKQILKNARAEEGLGAAIPYLARIFLNVCQAIAYTHSKGILHRDLKPENIIVGKYGEVMLLDWGLADFIDQPFPEAFEENIPTRTDLTMPGKIVGTLTYLAPERALGEKATVQTDIYSLGAILYQILTLRLPFPRTTLAAFRKQMHLEELIDPQEAAPYRDIPQPLADIAKKCLSSDKTQRYQSMAELLLDLENYIEGKPDWFLEKTLDIQNKEDWEFQENVLLAKHIALTRETEIMEWVSLMISKDSFSGNICLEALVRIGESGNGIGFLLGIPEARQRKGIEEGYSLWIGSSSQPGCQLFRSNVEVMHLPELFLEKEREYKIRIEKIDNNLRFFLDDLLKINVPSHIPMTGTHVGLPYRDDDLSLANLKIFAGSQNVMVNCLSIPDAFLAHQYFDQALLEYRRIGNCFHGRTEGREALFRAGITLVEKAALFTDKQEKSNLHSLAFEEFGKLRSTPGAPLEYLGKALVYKAGEDVEEEIKCLELALRKFPKHPLLCRLVDQILFRLHESSSNNRFAAYHFALLTLRHLPHVFSNPDHQRLLASLRKYWEPLSFIEHPEKNTALQLAFWLNRPMILIEMMKKEPPVIANALFALLELGEKEKVKEYLPLLSKDPQRFKQLEIALLPLEEALGTFFAELPATLSFIELRTLKYLFERALDADQAALILPFLTALDAYPLSETERFPFDLLHIWALLLLDKNKQAGQLFKKFPLEWVQEETTALFFLFGCYLWATEGEEIALTHLKGVHEIAHPPTPALLSHYLSGWIDLKNGWIHQAFFWEKRQLFRELLLFAHCSHQLDKLPLFEKLFANFL